MKKQLEKAALTLKHIEVGKNALEAQKNNERNIFTMLPGNTLAEAVSKYINNTRLQTLASLTTTASKSLCTKASKAEYFIREISSFTPALCGRRKVAV